MDPIIFMFLIPLIIPTYGIYVCTRSHRPAIYNTTYAADAMASGYCSVPKLGLRRGEFAAHYTEDEPHGLWPNESDLILRKYHDGEIPIPGNYYLFRKFQPRTFEPLTYIAKCTHIDPMERPVFDRPWRVGFDIAGKVIGYRFNNYIKRLC